MQSWEKAITKRKRGD
uniref:Uncharacterized protein n=1 Tax=Arundo donax TaxID=35708 RepID=A0A0A9D9X5_ARUDO